MVWLLRDETAREFRSAIVGLAPTAQHRVEFRASTAARSNENPTYRVAADTAEITVSGVLTEKPDFLCWLLGIPNTAYSDIREALALAASNSSVKSVSLRVASPGGHVDGLFATLAAIEAFAKPVTVQAAQACSAAYALAAAAGTTIEATGPAAEFGSIGVACSFAFDAGEEVIDVTSSHAPNKRPDPRTPDGKAVVVEYLDEIHALFADAIARGRNTTVETVNQSYGRGSSMLAGSAQERGMIDSIKGSTASVTSSAGAHAKQDLTDSVAQLLLEQKGAAPVAAPSVAGAHAQHDLTDSVAQLMLEKRGMASPMAASAAPMTAAKQPAAKLAEVSEGAVTPQIALDMLRRLQSAKEPPRFQLINPAPQFGTERQS